MSKGSMWAWGFFLLMGLGAAVAPRFLKGQDVGRFPLTPLPVRARVVVVAAPAPVADEPPSEVQQLALENRDRQQDMVSKARVLLARLNDRAEEMRAALRKTEAEIAAATDLLAEIDGSMTTVATPGSNVVTRLVRPRVPSQPEGPANWEYANNLAWGWATAANQAQRDGAKALEFAKRACELTHDANPLCLDTLAAAHAEVGDYGKAVSNQAKALQVGASDHADAFIARLLLYVDSKPYREPPAPAAPD